MSALCSRKNGSRRGGAKAATNVAVALAGDTQKAQECPVASGPVSSFQLPGRAFGTGLELLDREQLAHLELLDREQLARVIGLSPRTVSTLKKEKKIPFLRLSARCHKFVLADVLRALQRFEIREVGRK